MTETLDSTAVAAWLADNPNFFAEHALACWARFACRARSPARRCRCRNARWK
ncbi:hypothetical protein LP419_17785 [Massilia sp. H-1]|nr:hypothetical protein LP419_17785 [Massilia sp. H-1]